MASIPSARLHISKYPLSTLRRCGLCAGTHGTWCHAFQGLTLEPPARPVRWGTRLEPGGLPVPHVYTKASLFCLPNPPQSPLLPPSHAWAKPPPSSPGHSTGP